MRKLLCKLLGHRWPELPPGVVIPAYLFCRRCECRCRIIQSMEQPHGA